MQSSLQHTDGGDGEPDPRPIWSDSVPPVLQRMAEIALPQELMDRDLRGVRLNRYKIKGIIGRGAFGVVYEAEEIYPLDRSVAIKIASSSHDGDVVARRLRDEQRVLASIDDPGIVRIHDTGITPDGFPGGSGRPYFAMDYIKGVSITTYAQSRGLDIEGKLLLLIAVTRAVSATHKRGVIHRDLKPDHLLVDDDGAVRLIDFGIALRFGQDRFARTLTGHPVGTPWYMSPEQRNGGGSAVDTRTDVYSLGMILAELTLGDIKHLPDPLTLAREPLSDLLEPKEKHARRLCRQSIDWIVHKAIAASPDNRYQSADDFSADLTRAIARLPVTARPATWWVPFLLFARRKPAIAGSLSTFILAFVIGAALVTNLWLHNAGLARLAAQRESEARTEAQAAHLSAAQVAINSGSIDAARDHLLHIPDAMRSWPWHHLWYSTQAAGLPIFRRGASTPRENSLQSISIDASGHRLAIGAADGRVTSISSQTGALLSETSLPGQIFCVAYSPGPDARLAVGGEDGIVRLYADGDLNKAPRQAAVRHPIVRIAFSPDGKQCAIGMLGSPRVEILDGRSLEPQGTFASQGQAVFAICFSTDSRHLLIGNDAGVIETWDLIHRNRISSLSLAADRVQSICGAPDGALVAATTLSGRLLLLSAEASGALTISAQAHRSQTLIECKFDPTGRTLYSAGADSMIRAWSVPDLEVQGSWRQHTHHAYGLALDASGQAVYSSGLDGVVRVLKPAADAPASQRRFITPAQAHWDARGGFCAHRAGKSFVITNTRSGATHTVRSTCPDPHSIPFMCMSGAFIQRDSSDRMAWISLPDGQTLPLIAPQRLAADDFILQSDSATTRGLCHALDERYVLVRNAGSQPFIVDGVTGDIMLPSDELTTLIYDDKPDILNGTLALFWSQAGIVACSHGRDLYRVADVQDLDPHATVSDNGNFLTILQPRTHEIAVFNKRSQAQVARLPIGEVASVALSITSDGRCLAVARAQGSIDLIETGSGRTVLTLAGGEVPSSLAFDAENTLWMTGGTSIVRMWRTTNAARDNPSER
jgi:serine/threonine protein kinase/WD40 repeat protein